MNYKNQLISFLPNRVWRTYPGGKTLDRLQAVAEPKDTHFPEEWIASTTRAVNPGREEIHEGVSTAIVDGQEVNFLELIESDLTYFLGAAHVAKYGNNPMLLVKYLDAAVRLHFQAHPTVEFAIKNLNSNSGKAEAYYILDVREDVTEPYIYMGFQRPPSREKLKEMIETQDMQAMEACFDKVPVKKGDCYFIPGGIPHAIGEGILMVEVMEPSDFAVRFEFEKAGYTLPEEARFMQRGLDFCLDVFDYKKYSLEEIPQHFQAKPEVLAHYNDKSVKESLIDPRLTDRFRVCRSRIQGQVEKSEPDFFIGMVTEGECSITIDGKTSQFGLYDTFFIPNGVDVISIDSAQGVEIIECYPPLS